MHASPGFAHLENRSPHSLLLPLLLQQMPLSIKAKAGPDPTRTPARWITDRPDQETVYCGHGRSDAKFLTSAAEGSIQHVTRLWGGV